MNDAAKLPLAIETQARPEDLSVLSDGLSRHSGAATGIRDGELLCVFVRGGDQTVVDGGDGWTRVGEVSRLKPSSIDSKLCYRLDGAFPRKRYSLLRSPGLRLAQ